MAAAKLIQALFVAVLLSGGLLLLVPWSDAPPPQVETFEQQQAARARSWGGSPGRTPEQEASRHETLTYGMPASYKPHPGVFEWELLPTYPDGATYVPYNTQRKFILAMVGIALLAALFLPALLEPSPSLTRTRTVTFTENAGPQFRFPD